jgi:hypothetical protein
MNRRKHTGRSTELLFHRFAILFALMLLQGTCLTLYAQPNITRAEYFINTDPGFGSGTEITLAEGTTNSLSNHPFTVNTAALTTGIHQLFVRIKDANNQWSISNRTWFFKAPPAKALSAITQAEYFFDNEPGFGGGTPIDISGATTTFGTTFATDAATLTPGIHQLFVRIKDANNQWSISNRTVLYKALVKAAVAPNLVKAEYYIDTDPGFGNGIPVPITPTGVLTDGIIQVTVNGLSNGTHRLYLRMLDDAGKWSITNFDDFELTDAAPAPGLTLTGTSRNFLCAGQTITAGYDARGLYNPGNTFTVELSNETGSFDAPQTIGLVAGTSSGTIACTVPAGLAAGTGYRMRMVSSNPVATSPLYIGEFYKGCPDNGPLTVSLFEKTDVRCGGQSTGAINISISGGSEPYTIHWTKTGDAGFSRSTEDLTGIAAGEYAVTVTDDNGAAEGLTVTVGENAPLLVTPIVTQMACSVLGSIKLNITGGTGVYTVNWEDGPATTNRTNLTPDTYYATITDGSGCSEVIVATIDAPQQQWIPVADAPYNSGIVNKTTGSSYDEFTFQIIYQDANNVMPAGAYPKLLLDYEGNGSMNDPNDREYTMYSAGLDADLTNGKLYTVTVEGLPYGTNYTARAVVFTAVGCPVYSETYNGPDVVQAPNLQIFASDIRFTKYRTNPGETIEVTATIRNTSSEPANGFVVKLTSEFDPLEIFADQTISVQPYGKVEVIWPIQTPRDPASGQLIPMRVVVDEGDAIEESNELDNNAVRAYINGNYEVPGRIETTLTPNSVFTTCAGNRISFSGHAVYRETGIDGMDGSSVAGASVQVTLVNTGAVFSTVTNSLGNFTLNLPVLPAGTAYVLQGTTTDFSLIGNFTYQFGVSECPEPCTLPDLTVQVDFDPASIVQGSGTLASITVTNIGQSNAAATKLSVSYSGGPYGSQLLSIPLLATGESHTKTINLQFPDAGIYTLYARANAGDPSGDPVVFRIDECTEANNNGFASIEVRPNLPDLIPYGAPKGTDYLCENPSRTITIYNKGGVAATNFNVRAKIMKDGADVASHIFIVASLDHGQSKELEIPFTYTVAGTYSFSIEIDKIIHPGWLVENVTELDETNNDSVYTNSLIVQECLPDLIVEACPNNLVPAINPQEGGVMSIEATITNVGNATATAPFNVRFLFSDPLRPLALESVLADLTPGASATVTLSPTQVPPAGETITITADAGEIVTELYENNNSLTVSLCHELQPVISCDNTLFGTGQKLLQFRSLTPWVPVRTNGSYLAQGVKVRFFVKTPSSAVFTDLGIGTLSGTLSSCAACPAIASLGTAYAFNETGTYTFRYVVDPDDEFDECNEANNTLESQVEVTNAADMRIVSQYINPSKLNPALNEAVTFSITYENTGRSNVTDNMILRLMVDDAELAAKTVGGLLSGDKQTVSFTDPAWSSNAGGLHIVRAIIDADNDVADEADELNNEATRGVITGSSANLRIPKFKPDNAQPASGETITLTAEIVNDGDMGGEAVLLFTYLSPGGSRIEIGRKEFNFSGLQTQTVTLEDWPAVPNYATLIATIVDVSVLEYRTDDNEATTQIGNFAVEVVAADVICPDGSGSLQIIPSGGTGNYSITIWENDDLKWQNNDASGQVIVELPAGTYLVRVRDNGSGQTFDKSCVIKVTDCPTLLNVNITGTSMVTCYGSKTGSLTATPTGGPAPYTYLWSNGKTTQTISNLSAGEYHVTVTDDDGNEATDSHIISQPAKVSATVVATQVSCFGDTDGKIEVTGSGGTPGYTYSIDGTSYQASGLFENLLPGLYTIRIKDVNGCTGTVKPTVKEPALLTAGIVTIVPSCFGSSTGRIEATFTGGTGPKTYAWTGPNGFTAITKNIRKLAPGMYYLTVTDAKGCTAATTAEVTSYNQYFSNPVVTNTTCRGGNDGAISLSPTGGSGTGFNAFWTGPNSFTSTNEDISGLKPGTYRLFLTDDGTGCVLKESITVGQPATSVSVSATISKISSCGGTGSIFATATNGTAPYQYSINGVDFQGSVQFANLAAGTYTITAQDAIGCRGSRNFTVTDNGSDAYETNNTRTAAKALSIGTSIEARIGTTTDQDWFKFTSNATVIDYTIFMNHPSVAYSFDLYNGSGTLVAPASELLPDWKSYHLQANTTYYIRVTGTQSLLCYNLLVQAHGAPLITMLTAKPIKETETENALRTTAYPNPHNGNFTLEVNSPKSGEGHMILYDLQGRAIAERKEQFKAGLNQVRWTNMQVIPFVYRVMIGGENATGKILGIR